MKIRAARNRTISLTVQERERFLSCTASVCAPVATDEIDGKIINGDIMACLDFLPDKFVDLLVLDPPYNLTKDFNGRRFSRRSDEQYREYLMSWMPKMMRLLKDDASIYVCCDWRTSSPVYDVLKDLAHVRNRITWQREKGRGATGNWKNSMEDIWYATVSATDFYFDVDSVKQRHKVVAPYKSDGEPKDWTESSDGRFRDTCPSNFWSDITVPYWSMPENTDHPTQKPEKLLAKLILASCPEGGMVFDPFAGSGTSAVVAKKLGRRYCAVELDPEYAALAVCRLQRADDDKTIQGYSDGVFWERNAAPSRKKHS